MNHSPSLGVLDKGFSVLWCLSLWPQSKSASPICCHDREGDIWGYYPRVLLRVTAVRSIHPWVIG